MKFTAIGLAFFVGTLVLVSGKARASDPVGIYAVVEKVTAEPGWDAPEKVKIYGVFALAKGGGDNYEPAARGYLYYSINPKKPEVSKKEWADLRRIAGKDLCLGFGFRYDEKGKVHGLSEKAASPDPYPVNMGLQKITPTWYEPILQVMAYPRPVSPADGAEVDAGKAATLEIRAAMLPSRDETGPGPDRHAHHDPTGLPEKSAPRKAEYFFEIQADSGEKEESPAVAADGLEVKWTPAMKVKPGARYTWKAWLVVGKFHGPEGQMEYKGKPGV